MMKNILQLKKKINSGSMRHALPATSSSAGFTLIELVVTISIMAVMFSVLTGVVLFMQRNGRDARRVSDFKTVQTALQQYYTDVGNYPNSLPAAGDPLTNPSGTPVYLQAMPQDPLSGNVPYCYEPFLDQSEANCDNSAAGTGKCHYYNLCAHLEITPSTEMDCACGGNYYVNPN